MDGFGRIHLELPPVREGAPPRTTTALNVLLVGRDGSAVGVRSLGETVEVPIGEYRVGMVTFRLADAQGGQEWSFVFSEPGGRDDLTWYPVEKDAEVEIDPVGELDFQVGVGGDKTSCAPGDRLSGSPKLFTQDGLLINIAFRGRSAPTWSSGTLAADLSLLTPTGQILDRATSGFA